MAICVIAVVGVAPCQCFSLGANQTTSPELISSIGPPSPWTHPAPAVTIKVWPNGCVCQAVRAPASKVTLAPRTRAGSGASNKGSILTFPVNQSAGPLVDGRELDLLISISKLPPVRSASRTDSSRGELGPQTLNLSLPSTSQAIVTLLQLRRLSTIDHCI